VDYVTSRVCSRQNVGRRIGVALIKRNVDFGHIESAFFCIESAFFCIESAFFALNRHFFALNRLSFTNLVPCLNDVQDQGDQMSLSKNGQKVAQPIF
jgi:hypothetical protein